ncbi:MAG: TlyA family RNA methyltransferase [Armatimonadetes bacterium]|nr:TlyA family RNA methyltransferase [Armatimonadota bacterium]
MPPRGKRRVDLLLVEKGLCSTRERAQAAVMAGLVYADGHPVSKAGTPLPETCCLELRGGPLPYVSRGGLKMEKALDVFGVPVAGKRALDIGASTGGFTDCLLQHGASSVVAVDVGRGQLDWKLRQDSRVTVLERTNARYLTQEQIGGERVDLAVVDVSFISLTLILPVVAGMIEGGGWIIALVKPQFEAGQKQVEKGGVVRDPEVHVQVLEKVLACASGCGLVLEGVTWSPLRGPAGNLEYLAAFRAKERSTGTPEVASIRDVVRRAHQEM